MKPPVNSKDDFVRRYAKGEFGNAAPTWKTIDDFMCDPYNGLTHIRNKIPGGPTFYNLPADEVRDKYRELLEGGMRPENLYFSAMAPHDTTVIQGEIRRSINHLDLRCTFSKLPMREAFKEQQIHLTGLNARTTMQAYVPHMDREWIDYLLDEYEDHIVEFSTFGVQWGTVPGYQTVYWEVRNY